MFLKSFFTNGMSLALHLKPTKSSKPVFNVLQEFLGQCFICYKVTATTNNNNETRISRSAAGTLHVVGFVKRINMKEGSVRG